MRLNLKAARIPVAALAISLGGLGFISQHEGTKQRAYLDIAGVPTICTGHTGPEVKLGQYYTKEQCDELLSTDAASAVAVVRKNIKVPLYQSEFDALVDFCYNVGQTACRNSTVFKYLNNGDYNAAGQQFLRWKFAGGKDCSIQANGCYGIYQRRLDELALFKSEH